MRPSRAQLIRIILLSIPVVAMLVLAAGLPQLELTPGVPFEQIWQFLLDQFRGGEDVRGGLAPLIGNADLLIRIMQTIFVFALVLFPLAVIMVMLDPELRKRVVRTLLVMVLIFTLAGMWLNNLTELEEGEDDIFGAPGNLDDLRGGADPFTDESFDVEGVPSWIPLGLSLVAGLLVALIVISVVRQVRRDRLEREASLAPFARRVEMALDELEQGGDLQNTITRCYAEMIHMVREQRGVQRGSTVTAREFTDHLIRAKMPPSAVNRLTQLFESVRYGLGGVGPQDETDAITSLQAIADACRSLS